MQRSNDNIQRRHLQVRIDCYQGSFHCHCEFRICVGQIIVIYNSNFGMRWPNRIASDLMNTKMNREIAL